MTKNIWFTKQNMLVGALVLVFTTFFALISLFNHYQFRTSALDMGMFNHALYSFAHFKANYFTLNLDGSEYNYFSTHFSFITLLCAPLYYLFGSYTLLVVQIVSISAAGIALYQYAIAINHNKTMATLLMVQFFCIWGLYSALSFDFHENVVGAMLLPWFLLFYQTRKRKKALLFFVLILLSKENMALWLVFVLLGLGLQNGLQNGLKNIRQYLRFEIPLAAAALLYFIVVTMLIMPHLQATNTNLQLSRYAHLGTSAGDIMINLLKNPIHTFSLLFESSQYKAIYFGIKSELHFMVLVSGGIAFLRKPYFLLMLLPVYLQKMLSSDAAFWGISYHYSIEFAPILTVALAHWLHTFADRRIQYTVVSLVLFTTVLFNMVTINTRRALWFNNTNTAFYKSKHYDAGINLNDTYKAINMIPDDVSLSVGSSLAPHLFQRDKLYLFPVVKDAEYIALFTQNRGTYPLNREQFDKEVAKYKDNGQYSVVFDNNELLILKRK